MGKQAVFALVWFRQRRPLPLIGTGRGICQPTSSRSLTEATCVLAAQAPDLHQALRWVADDGWPHVVGDSTIIDSDRSREKTTSRTGMTIDAG